MATVFREGGTSPIKVKNWRDAVKLQLLGKIYDYGGNRLFSDIFKWFDEELDWIQNKWKHELIQSEAREILEEIIAEGLVEVSEFTCACCAKQNHSPKEILHHAKRLRLTKAGYSKVPESILP